MRVTASAPGNLFFLGEHAVVYDQPCMITSVGKRTTVEVEERSDKRVEVESEAFGKASAEIGDFSLKERMTETDELEITLDLCEHLVSELEVDTGFSLHIASQIPVKSGMSSSTALLSAILAALSEMVGSPVKKEEFWDWLYPFQVTIHGGKASGSEIISSALGGFNTFQKAEEGIEWASVGRLPCAVVVADTRVSVATSMTVGYHVPSLIDRDERRVMQTFDEIGSLTDEAKSAVRSGDLEAIGELMNRDQELLSSLGLSHPKLDDCISEALEAGALGAKLSGKGWGGIMFALCTEETQEDVAKAMARTRADVMMTEIGVEGVRVE